MFDFEKCIFIYSIQQMSFWLCKNCGKTQKLASRRDLYTLALAPFNYHIKVKCKCLYQFLIKLTLSEKSCLMGEELSFDWRRAAFCRSHKQLLVRASESITGISERHILNITTQIENTKNIMLTIYNYKI